MPRIKKEDRNKKHSKRIQFDGSDQTVDDISVLTDHLDALSQSEAIIRSIHKVRQIYDLADEGYTLTAVKGGEIIRILL